MTIAFFDLDLTLLAINSGSVWVRRELREGRLSVRQIAQAGYWFLQYRLGKASLHQGLRTAIGTLKGSASEVIRQQTEEFYELRVKGMYRPGALEAINDHRQRGDTLCLLSTTTMYMADVVVRELGLHHALCNRFQIDENGLHTGHPEGSICYGIGKVEHAEAYAKTKGLSLSDCTFYTDSITDLPVLARMGLPVVVNPDKRLRREALRRGWKIVDWGQPAPAVQASAAPG